jgi:hypothetical protein
LFERFNATFWDDELGFYAYALDGDKKKILTVASDAGGFETLGRVWRQHRDVIAFQVSRVLEDRCNLSPRSELNSTAGLVRYAASCGRQGPD